VTHLISRVKARPDHVDALERLHHPTERIVDPLNTFTSRVKRISLDLGTYDITELEISHQNNFAYLEKRQQQKNHI
jgi:hypothetical protein